MRCRVLVTAAIILALAHGVAVAGSNSSYYYAQTGVDGVIYCASAHATATSTTPGVASASGQTRSWKNLYCGTSNSVPSGYLKVTVYLVDSTGLCRASDPKSNTSTAAVVTATIPATSCELGVYARTDSEAAVNFAWRTGSVTAYP